MKRSLAIMLAIWLTICTGICASADTIKVSIDLSAMDTTELYILDALVHQELANRGEDNLEDQILENNTKPNVYNESDESLDTLAEGEADLSDDSFLRDMSAGLVARWEVPDQDTSIMSDKQLITYFTSLVNSELLYVSKYSDYSFTDERLGSYAHSYINALQNQLIGITEYRGKDEKLYTQYWSTDGYNVRARYIYLINKEYGLEIPSSYNSILAEMVNVGILYNYVVPMEKAVTDELYEIELDFDTSSSKYLYTKPFNLTNTSPYDISGLTVQINFINSDEIVVDSSYLLLSDNVAADTTVSTRKASTKEHFTHITYSYSFTVRTNSYYHECTGTIIPAIQYSWDGRVKENGQLATGQAILEIENLVTGWEMNTSWSKTLYVPVLKFDVLNSGTGEAERVVVRVVITNPETAQVWDEKTTYVVGTSDSPLKPGYSKKTFVYSSVGYKTKITPPSLNADIYINDEFIQTVAIAE